MTTWKAIPGWIGLYEASDDGQIRSLTRVVSGRRHVGRIIRHSITPKGYRIVILSGRGVRKAYPLHRLIAETWIGPMPEGMQTRHLNDDKADTRVANLAYGTRADNEADKITNGFVHHNAAKSHCPQGHPYDEANTAPHRNGDKITGRRCRECHREAKRAYDARRRAKSANRDARVAERVEQRRAVA